MGECDRIGRTDGKSVIFEEVKNMEERIIKLTLEKAKEFYKKGGEFKDLVLSAFTKEELEKVELPKTWDEFCELYKIDSLDYYIDRDSSIVKAIPGPKRDSNSDRNLLPKYEATEAHLALMQLHQLRDCYRQGWKPDWNDDSTKYYVYVSNHGLNIMNSTTNISYFLSFQTKEIATEFLYNFRDLIIQAGDLV